jgi:hypothetical protein
VQVLAEIRSLFKVPRVAIFKVTTIVLVYRLEDIVDWCVPGFPLWSIPLAGHCPKFVVLGILDYGNRPRALYA